MDNALDTPRRQQRSLLFVDDEENVLHSLERACRRDGYKIFTATSGPEALELLDKNEIHVVVSDQRMAIMSGIEFLKAVKARFPDTVRIVLSGYTDLDAVTSAINEGAIYKFITKPWEDDALRGAIGAAFRHFDVLDKNIKLTRELKDVNEKLERANAELTYHLELQEKYAKTNINITRNTQEILEILPIAVIGIDDTGMVAIANDEAGLLFDTDAGVLIGQSIKNILDGGLFEIYSRTKNSCEIIRDYPVTAGNKSLKISGRQRVSDDGSKSIVIVITNNVESSRNQRAIR